MLQLGRNQSHDWRNDGSEQPRHRVFFPPYDISSWTDRWLVKPESRSDVYDTNVWIALTGLPLGGLLAHPEQRSTLFNTAFWAEYPYLLPCLVGAAFALFSVVPGIMFIEEVRLERLRVSCSD
jgi:hypothetical protein